MELAQDLKNIVSEDYVYTNLYERANYADTSLPYDVEEGDLPDIVVHPANAQEISEVKFNQEKIEITLELPGIRTGDLFFFSQKVNKFSSSTNNLSEFNYDSGLFVKLNVKLKEKQTVCLELNEL